MEVEKVVGIALAIVRELVKRHAQTELSLLDRHSDLLRDLLVRLASLPKDQWTEQSMLNAKTGMAAIAEGEQQAFVLAMSRIQSAIMYGLLRTRGQPSADQISAIVAQETKQLSQKLREETNELWIKGMSETTKLTRVSEDSVVKYLVFEGTNRRPASEEDVAKLWNSINEFIIFVDTVKQGWYYKDQDQVMSIPLTPGCLEWHFLCLALQRVGGYWNREELIETIQKSIGEREFIREPWQLRERLNKYTNGIVGSIIKGQPKGGGYRIEPAKTCLIEILPP